MYVTTIIKEKEATKSPTLKEDMGRVGGTKERGKWYNSISIENTVFTKRTKKKIKICLSFAIFGLSFIIYFIAVFEQRIMQKTSAPVFQGGWHGRTPLIFTAGKMKGVSRTECWADTERQVKAALY